MRVVAVSLFVFLPLQFAQAEDPIRVGALLHVTGDLAAPATAFREGVEVAIDSFAPRYKLFLEDGQNSARASYDGIRKLVSEDKIEVAILESYMDVMGGGKLLERKKLPSICLWDSNPEIEAAGETIFAIGPWTASAAEVASGFATKDLQAKTAVVYFSTDPWSETVHEIFEKEFTKSGGKILGSYRLSIQDMEFRSLLSRGIALKPDVIYTPIVYNLLAFYSQLKNLGNRSAVISSDIIADSHIAEAPDAFEGIYQTGIRNPDSPEYENFRKLYIQKYQREPALPWFSAVGYDAMKLVNLAVEKEGRAGISKGLYAIRNYSGASANLTFNEKGVAPQFETMMRITGGKLVLLPMPNPHPEKISSPSSAE